MMTESVKGKTLDEGKNLFEWFHRLLTAPPTLGRPGGTVGKARRVSRACASFRFGSSALRSPGTR